MKKTRRAGATQTFSVSVDPATKRALRALANEQFGGNLSALVTDLAEEARRRMAAGQYLKRHGLATPTTSEVEVLEAEIASELQEWKGRRRKRRVA